MINYKLWSTGGSSQTSTMMPLGHVYYTNALGAPCMPTPSRSFALGTKIIAAALHRVQVSAVVASCDWIGYRQARRGWWQVWSVFVGGLRQFALHMCRRTQSIKENNIHQT